MAKRFFPQENFGHSTKATTTNSREIKPNYVQFVRRRIAGRCPKKYAIENEIEIKGKIEKAKALSFCPTVCLFNLSVCLSTYEVVDIHLVTYGTPAPLPKPQPLVTALARFD